MNDSRGGRIAGTTAALLLAFGLGAGLMVAEGPALRLHATDVGTGPSSPLTVELYRWSTDAERAAVHAAFTAPPPAPPPPAPPGAAAGRGRAGRGGRGAAPLSREARIAAAIKAAPTFGYIWGDGATGYSIKYAWRGPAGGAERIVLVIDRRLGSHAAPIASATGPAAEQDYTVVEMRIDAKGGGEGRTSRSTRVVMDTAANVLALDAAAPVELKVTR